MSWYDQSGADMDVVISSRIRLARNFKNIPFRVKMNEEQCKKVLKETKEAIINDKTVLSSQFDFINFNDLSKTEKMAMVERYITSTDLLTYPYGGVLLSKDEKVSIMINEEDHIRLQVLSPGFSLLEAWNYADKIDNILEENIEYAFDENYGYLTSCPTNMGTGLRASVMMHLPGLEMTHNMQRVLEMISKFGLTIRGIHGEGSEALGSLYQISNQVTLGQSEEEIIENLIAILNKIIEQERQIRKTLLQESPTAIEDQIFRSYGLLKYARKISYKEAFKLLSDVKVGVDLGLIKEVEVKDIINLWMRIQPASIELVAHQALTAQERDIKRAQFIQETLR